MARRNYPIIFILFIFLLSNSLFAEGPSMGFSIKVVFPSIKIEINEALMYGKLYGAPRLSPFVGYEMGEAVLWVEVVRESHTPDLSYLMRVLDEKEK